VSELLNKLKASGGAVRAVQLRDVTLGLRILNDQDYLDAGCAALEEMKSRGIEFGMASADLFEAEKASQLLVLALVDPENGKPLAGIAKQVRSAFSSAEKQWLIQQYLDHEREWSPSERTMTPEQFAELVETVKKTPETALSIDSSSATLRRLLLTLASPPAA
jgi:hypothetical protein